MKPSSGTDTHVCVLTKGMLGRAATNLAPRPDTAGVPLATAIKWDTVPLNFAPKLLKSKRSGSKQVGHFFDLPDSQIAPRGARVAHEKLAPKKCHSVQPFYIRKSLKTKKSGAKEVSHFSRVRAAANPVKLHRTCERKS